MKTATNPRIVSLYLKGGKADLPTTTKLIAQLSAGLPIAELRKLAVALKMNIEKLAVLLGISPATLHRRVKQGKLDARESERLVRYARLLGIANDVFESQDAGRAWLAAPQFGLGGQMPLEYARTEVGAREVESLLGRIEHSVFS
ncbi:MAG: DUF2384 domain-containing protein [Armatimonadetes bacterium]|nr:DUF2384 domain-containing protein [Akkermansiaceae bacterium]